MHLMISAAVSYTHIDVYKRQLLEQEFDLLLKTVGVSPDLSQLLALEILQQFEGCLLYTSRCV